MAHADTNKLMGAYLRSFPELVNEVTVNGRVQIYGPPGLAEDYEISPAIEYHRNGIRLHTHLPVASTMFQVRCYAPKPWDSERLFSLLKPILHMQAVVDVTAGSEQGRLQFSKIENAIDMLEPPPLNWSFIQLMVEMHWITELV